MKLAALFAAVCTLLIQSQPGTESVVQGIVTTRKDSRPLSGVTITLAPGVKSPPTLATRTANVIALLRTAQTDGSGNFAFAGVAPGDYTVHAEGQGYSESTVQLVVDPQRRSRNLSFALTKTAVISGRLSDPAGQAAAGMMVEALRLEVSNGLHSWSYPAATAQTNVRGEYRLFGLDPGTYYVRYIFPTMGAENSLSQRQAKRGGSPQDSYASTYFPGKVDGNLASPIAVDDGGEAANINFSIQSGSNATIIGVVTPANPRERIPLVMLVPNSPNAIQSFWDFTAVAPSRTTPGAFEFQGVPLPGSYTLYATRNASPNRLAGQTPVTVSGKDIDNVTIALEEWGVPLTCHITISGAAPGTVPPLQIFGQIQIRGGTTIPEILFPSGFGQSPADPQGDLRIAAVPPGSYDFLLFPSPAPIYVADIRRNGTSVFDSGIPIGTSPVTVEVVVKNDGGQIEGVLLGPGKEPMPDTAVVLVPPPSHRQNQALYKSVKTDTSGYFQMYGISPGEYKLFAGPSFDNKAYLDPEVLAKYEEAGQAVKVNPLQHVDIQLNQAIP